MVGNGLEYARTFFTAGIRIRTHDVLGDAEINAVAFVLPAPAAVEAIISTIVLADARAFKRVPIPVAAVHQPICLEALPIQAGPQNRLALVLQLSHAFHCGNHWRGSRSHAVRRIEKVASVKEIPASVVILEWVWIDCERTNLRVEKSLA